MKVVQWAMYRIDWIPFGKTASSFINKSDHYIVLPSKLIDAKWQRKWTGRRKLGPDRSYDYAHAVLTVMNPVTCCYFCMFTGMTYRSVSLWIFWPEGKHKTNTGSTRRPCRLKLTSRNDDCDRQSAWYVQMPDFMVDPGKDADNIIETRKSADYEIAIFPSRFDKTIPSRN